MEKWSCGARSIREEPKKTSWDILQKVAPHREEPLLDGNAHSVRYGETIHDGSGKPVSVHHQEQAYFENFVMGSDTQQNLWTKSRTKCETDRKECRTMQSQVKSIQ